VDTICRRAVVQQGRGREPEQQRVIGREHQELGDVVDEKLNLEVAAQHHRGLAGGRERERGVTGEQQPTAAVQRVDDEVEAGAGAGAGVPRAAPGDDEGVRRPEVAHLDARVREAERLGVLAPHRAVSDGGAALVLGRGGGAHEDPGPGGAARGLRVHEVHEGVRGHQIVRRRRGLERERAVVFTVWSSASPRPGRIMRRRLVRVRRGE